MRYITFTIILLFILASCKNKNKIAADPDTYFTCSMDPQVVEYKPGKCPICKMDLTPVKKKKGSRREVRRNDPGTL